MRVIPTTPDESKRQTGPTTEVENKFIFYLHGRSNDQTLCKRLSENGF